MVRCKFCFHFRVVYGRPPMGPDFAKPLRNLNLGDFYKKWLQLPTRKTAKFGR